MPVDSWRADPVPGAPPGKSWRRCLKPGHAEFQLVRSFVGVYVYQCLVCRQIALVKTRTGKTCMNCGKPLTGRQQNWCCEDHGREVANSYDRAAWRRAVLERDSHTCRRCGWHATPELETVYVATNYRQLEAHHVHPLEWGGPEFDVENGMTLCESCHDQEHRELNAERARHR